RRARPQVQDSPDTRCGERGTRSGESQSDTEEGMRALAAGRLPRRPARALNTRAGARPPPVVRSPSRRRERDGSAMLPHARLLLEAAAASLNIRKPRIEEIALHAQAVGRGPRVAPDGGLACARRAFVPARFAGQLTFLNHGSQCG